MHVLKRLVALLLGLAWCVSCADAGTLSGSTGWLDKTGMTVTASVNEDRAGMLLDSTLGSGDDTAWNSGYIPGANFPIFATVDMGKTYTLSGFRYWQGNGYGVNAPTLSVSSDGMNFSALTTLTSSYDNWNSWDSFTFAPVAARFVRISFLQASDNVNVAELDMFSAPLPIPDVPGRTANDAVRPYNGLFAYGSNMGYYGWNNNDEDLAGLLVGDASAGFDGAGVHSLRPGLYDNFIEGYGVDIRVDQFAYYKKIGARDLVLFLNGAYGVSGDRRDPNMYGGCNQQSWFEANLYKPIWAKDAQGNKTANPENYLAAYIASVVATYRQYGIKFYEVWNEPDYTYDYDAAWNTSSPNFWGSVNPQPCSLPNTNAPISHHVRLHRVIYEVVHAYDPTAYVATGGLGYPSYLSAMLRNTDNPGTSMQQNPGEGDGAAEGTVSARYPKLGGAYFDVLSYHSYPQYDLNHWVADNGTCEPGDGKRGPSGNMRCYDEHSDAAVQDYLARGAAFHTLLLQAGYDGSQYPAKPLIVTETNVPRVPARYVSSPTKMGAIQQWGSEAYNANYIIKALVMSQKNAIQQVWVFGSADEALPGGLDCQGNLIGTDNNKMEGLFQRLDCGQPGDAVPTSEATAYKTVSGILFGFHYDAALTTALALPAGTDGAAFTNLAGARRYALWAQTTADRSEIATATYSFPKSLGLGTVTRREWNFSLTGRRPTVPATGIILKASPSFFD